MANIYDNLVAYTMPAAPVGRKYSRAEEQLRRQPSVKLATANTARNEVVTVATFGGTATGGNFTLTVNIPVLGVTYTTANLAHDANAAAIEAALDTASPATIGDGDVAVTAGATNFTDGNMVFACAVSVGRTPVLITITDVDLSGTDPTVGAVVRTTSGQPDRNAMQALIEMNIIDGTIPDAGEAPSDWALPSAADYIGKVKRARLETIEFLAVSLVTEEGIKDGRDDVRALYNLPQALYGPH